MNSMLDAPVPMKDMKSFTHVPHMLSSLWSYCPVKSAGTDILGANPFTPTRV